MPCKYPCQDRKGWQSDAYEPSVKPDYTASDLLDAAEWARKEFDETWAKTRNR